MITIERSRRSRSAKCTARAAGLSLAQVRGWRLRLGLKRKRGTSTMARLHGAMLDTPTLAQALRELCRRDDAPPPDRDRVPYEELREYLAKQGMSLKLRDSDFRERSPMSQRRPGVNVDVGILELATMTNSELARRGLPRDTITFERLRYTGHPRRISTLWSRTIGWWGGVRSMRSIADELEMPIAQVHSWAQWRRLRTRTRKYERTQAQLAVGALATPGPAREVATAMGVLPVEVVLYRASAERMRTELRVTPAQILRWSPERLEDAWHILGLGIEGPSTRTTVNVRDSVELAAVVEEALARAKRPNKWDVALSAVRRELPDVGERHGTLRAEFARDLDEIIAVAEARVALEDRR